MTRTIDTQGYRYIPGPFQYSGGVAALSGFAIERVRFASPVPLLDGFRRIEALLHDAGLPLTAFCACELRSPAQFSDAGFIAFNRDYVGTLQRWGIFADDRNPVARSNVCPEIDPPPEPGFHAFSFVRPSTGAAHSFVVAGSGEAQEGSGPYRDKIIRHGDTSAGAIAEKARYVLDVMQRRMAALDGDWGSTTAVQVYTVHDLYPFLGAEIVARGAAHHGLTWHFCRPPVIGLEYEMDCRAVASERVIPA
ncbi:2-amino-5-chloromuconate deaminase CnbZ [Rhodopila sp.]|uniref:2-amino-5-chloromuconate deaminase CnbZ n=1 Tax=Rhodopila sp. TaxID=2480087 RepID=UPI003D0ADE8F